MRNHDNPSLSRDRDSRSWNSDNYGRDAREQRSAFGWSGDRSRDSYGRSGSQDSRAYDRSGERSNRFGNSDERNLIASDRVEGTQVYDRNGDKLGTIHNFMVEKRGGRVAYAVMKCSDGFLGMDERYYPLDWHELDYDEGLGGYCVNMGEHDLDHRPAFDSRGQRIDSGSSSDRQNSDRYS